jgi:sulfur carrier protein
VNTLQVIVNAAPQALPAGSTLAQLLDVVRPREPFAVAVNLRFVPRQRYGETPLADGDRIEIIAPVTGG